MGVKHRNKKADGTQTPDKGSFASSTAEAVRTPWGVFDVTRRDEDARDPFEPDDPIVLYPDAPGARSATAAVGGSPAPVTPRELYDMLIAPAAHPSRSSPVRYQDGLLATPPAEASADVLAFPAQADMVISALEAGQGAAPAKDRRGKIRRTYRVRGVLRLYSDQSNAVPRVLYTRDIHSRGVGFITQHRLPLGYGGEIELPDPSGGSVPIRIAGTLLRCREAASGWFEGSLYFNSEHPEFDEK